MPAWKANTSVIRNQSEEMKNLAARLSRMSDSVVSSGSLNGIHFDGQAAVEIRIRELGSNLQIESARVSNLGNQLSVIAQLYEATENQIKNDASGISKIVRSTGGGASNGGAVSNDSHNGPAGGSSAGGRGPEEAADATASGDESDKWYWDFIMQYFKSKGKFTGDEESSMMATGMGYLKDLFGFYTGDKKGWSGLADLCDLGKSSSDLWTALYKKMDIGGLLEGRWGTKVAGLGIAASSVGLLGKIAEAICGDNSTGWNITANIFDAGSGIFDVGQSIYEFKNFAKLAESSQGLWTSAGQWATLGETVTSTLSQAFKSIGKYSADGKWDLGDTAATGIDSAITGLEKLISGVTFGTISAKTFGTDTDQMSDAVKNWAGNTGKSAGDYIVNNKDMLNKYQNGNTLDRIGITFTATVATAASWLGF